MEFMRKIIAVSTFSFLAAGSVLATETNPIVNTVEKTTNSFLNQKWNVLKNFCTTKKDSLLKTIADFTDTLPTKAKQLNKSFVRPLFHHYVPTYAPAVGGFVGQFNLLLGSAIAGLGIYTRTKFYSSKKKSPLITGYNILKSGLEAGSSLALTRGLVNGNMFFITVGTFGSLIRLGCKLIDGKQLQSLYYMYQSLKNARSQKNN